MAMRITNKIMTNNSLTNINNNKVLQDKLNNQINTGKKIVRPSDDPVIAIRALRLRSGLSDINQYLGKNIEDAECWIQTTEDAVVTAGDLLDDMRQQCEKGADDELQIIDRNAILEQLKNLRREFYATGDADYAGRQLFTGYRTSTPLTFQEKTEQTYKIYEQTDKTALEDFTYIGYAELDKVTETNYGELKPSDGTNPATNVSRDDVYETTLHRIRVSYDNLDMTGHISEGIDDKDKSKIPSALELSYTDLTKTDNPKTDEDDRITTLKEIKVTYDASTGEPTLPADAPGIIVQSKYDKPNPYELMAKYGREDSKPSLAECAILIPETGELLLGDKLNENLLNTRDEVASGKVNEGEIRLDYFKSTWEKGDVNPVHYFACYEDNGLGKSVTHNWELLNGEPLVQDIEYDVGNNQSIKVNSTANEVFDLGVGRVVDELVNLIDEVEKLEAVEEKMRPVAQAEKAPEDAIQTYEAIKKALDMMKKKMQTAFGSAMTSFRDYFNQTNRAITDIGTRGTRVELVKNRLDSQQTNFKDLVSDNEQVDVTEAAIDLASAKLTYDASLMATGKIAQTTLMNYI